MYLMETLDNKKTPQSPQYKLFHYFKMVDKEKRSN